MSEKLKPSEAVAYLADNGYDIKLKTLETQRYKARKGLTKHYVRFHKVNNRSVYYTIEDLNDFLNKNGEMR